MLNFNYYSIFNQPINKTSLRNCKCLLEIFDFETLYAIVVATFVKNDRFIKNEF